jgi:hypothetical protein
MIYDNLLKEDNKNVLEDLIERCNLVKTIDIDELKILCELAAKATNIGANLPGKLDEILDRWYASLKHDSPDYTVYAEDEYIAELWACWKVYSKTHLINIQKGT